MFNGTDKGVEEVRAPFSAALVAPRRAFLNWHSCYLAGVVVVEDQPFRQVVGGVARSGSCQKDACGWIGTVRVVIAQATGFSRYTSEIAHHLDNTLVMPAFQPLSYV